MWKQLCVCVVITIGVSIEERLNSSPIYGVSGVRGPKSVSVDLNDNASLIASHKIRPGAMFEFRRQRWVRRRERRVFRTKVNHHDAVFRKELAWREFHAHVLHAWPHSARDYFKPELKGLPYVTGRELRDRLAAWTEGRTGYPIVDAGMRQLLAEGWMHNRVRMITASFLTKDLHVWWPVGARHFLDLLIDGEVGFTGGMNIGRRHLVAGGGAGVATDMHFELRGPILNQLGQVFADDWRWCGQPDRVLPAPADRRGDAAGAAGRVVTDGPNEDYDHLTMVLQAAISAAHREVLIMTPYFLPPNEMIAELQAAAVRGVRVDVILPLRSNLPFVHWATRNMLGELLRRGVRVFYQPPPFCHSKLFVVDGVPAMAAGIHGQS